MSVTMGTGTVLLEGIFALVTSALLLVPIVQLTRAGYDPALWWQRTGVPLLPFSFPVRISAPLSLWYLSFWATFLYALATTARAGGACWLALVVAGVEGFYALLRVARRSRPSHAVPADGVLSFALWHNAVLEEVLFRGLPLFVGSLLGLSRYALWPLVYVAVTAVGFGLYHFFCMGRPSRAADTTVLGVVLGIVTLRFGLAVAILLHCIHNALSVPLGETTATLPRWRRRRTAYVLVLSAVGICGVSVLPRFDLLIRTVEAATGTLARTRLAGRDKIDANGVTV